MIQVKKRFLCLGVMCLLMAFLGCADGAPIAGGGGVETTNNIVDFKVVYPNREVAPNISIKVRPSDYSASTYENSDNSIQDLQTDDQGRVEIALEDDGEFFIEINDNSSHATLLQLIIANLTSDTTLADQIVDPYAQVSGSINQSVENKEELFVQIIGLERVAEVSSSGEFTFTDLPEGEYTMEVISTSSDIETVELPDVVVVSGEKTEIIVNDDSFVYEKSITINTTETGANITEALHHFPLLVKLDSSNFDFANIVNESDIQFVKNSGDVLPHEVEFFDAQTQTANIWVEIDTIYALAQTVIKLQWGMGNAQDESDALFSTTNGYSGVWHLNSVDDVENSASSTVLGENFGATAIEGIIGSAFNYENRTYTMLPAEAFSNLDQEVTISLWQYGIDVPDEKYSTLFDARDTDTSYAHRLTVHLPWYKRVIDSPTIFWDAGDSAQNYSRIFKAVDSTDHLDSWNHWTFTKNAETAEMSIFRNGELFHTEIGDTSSMSGIGIFKLGGILDPDSQNSLSSYNGYVDEFRVSHVVRSDAWIRMNYETQKNGSSVVTVGGE